MLEQAIDDEAAGGGVEISGRLVGEQQFWLGDKGAGDRHALLLAARELSGIMAQAMTEADRGETLGGSGEGIASPGEFKRHATFSSAVIVGIR